MPQKTKRKTESAPTPVVEQSNQVATNLLCEWVAAVNDGQDAKAKPLHARILNLYDSGIVPDWAHAGLSSPSAFFGWANRFRKPKTVPPPPPPPEGYSDSTMVEFRHQAQDLRVAANSLVLAQAHDPFHDYIDRIRDCLQAMETLCPRAQRRKEARKEQKSTLTFPGFRGTPGNTPGKHYKA